MNDKIKHIYIKYFNLSSLYRWANYTEIIFDKTIKQYALGKAALMVKKYTTITTVDDIIPDAHRTMNLKTKHQHINTFYKQNEHE